MTQITELVDKDMYKVSSAEVYMLRKLEDGLPWWFSGKESACLCRRCRFNPWSGKIPLALEQLSLWATTIQPVLQSLGTTPEPAHHN